MRKTKDLPKLENRSYLFEIRAEQSESGAIITGTPIVYERQTDLHYFFEIIERGALDKTDLTDVRFLVNHDTSKIPLARSRRNNENSTMQLTVTFNGMDILVNLDIENNSEARNLYSAVSRGDITGMSFMFSVDGEEWENLESDHPTRRIKSIASVVEVSAVTFPAYQDTSISARDNKSALENARKALENVKPLENVVEKRLLELEKAKNENRMKGGN